MQAFKYIQLCGTLGTIEHEVLQFFCEEIRHFFRDFFTYFKAALTLSSCHKLPSQVCIAFGGIASTNFLGLLDAPENHDHRDRVSHIPHILPPKSPSDLTIASMEV